MEIRNYAIYGVITLVQFYIIGLGYGNNHGYMTILNYYPNKADVYNLGFICYIPPIEYDRYSSDDLTFGKSYATVMTDDISDVEFSQFPSARVDYIATGSNVYNFGVYYCKLQEDGKTTIVDTTKINSNAVIKPSNSISSITANVGDTVTISFDVDGHDVMTPFVWRKDGIEITNSENAVSMTFDSVTVDDAGMYEMHGTGQRSEQKHSFINLIVRGCPRHKWGTMCQFDCNFCYNGGVCDDKTGQCICAPGFMGTTCHTECGGNRFGWDCGQLCSRSRNDNSACKQYQFCVQDPHGCSCVTGYKGADCVTECPHGTFGAGCTEVCHCHSSSNTCDRYTGKCSGPCQSRWKGSNCQECEDNYYGENCESECSKPCSCSRITGTCVKCNDGWLENECELGIVDIFFTSANNGQMTDIYCRVKHGSTSTIETKVQIESVDGTREVMHIGLADENDGITNYLFTEVADINSEYYCVIQNDGVSAKRKYNKVIYRLPIYSGKINVIQISGSTIEVAWTEWNNKTDNGDGPIIGYVIHYKEIYKQDSNWMETQLIDSVSGMIVGLQWETNYTIAVSAVREGKGGQGPVGTNRAFAQTFCGEPDPVNNALLEIIESEITFIVITWSAVETTYDVLKCSNFTYYVYTVYLTTDDETKQLYRGSNTSFQFEYDPKYVGNIIAVTVSNKDSESSPVERNIKALKGLENDGSPSAGAIGGAIGGVVSVCIIIGLICTLIIRRNRRADSSTPHVNTTSSNVRVASTDGEYEGYVIPEIISGVDATYEALGPKESRASGEEVKYETVGPKESMNFNQRINVLEFIRYVAKSKKTHQLQKDFESLPKNKLHSWDCALQEPNVAKNRSKNIIPYDKHRVVLNSYDGSDYYNASYIDGFFQKKHYIASQGPNEASLKDFWRMIWQKEISIIVMLTNVNDKEKKNCKAYWPENIDTYNGITVSFQNEEINDYFCVRTFAMWLKSNDVSRRIVKQYHYMSWPESDIPRCTSDFLEFITEVRSVRSEYDLGIPLLVHCSTGGGRTGTYIVIDAMLDMMKAEQSVNVLGCVKDVEEQRISMVQTVEQYIFIHDALVEFYLNDTVQISISNFQNQLQYLKRLNPVSSKPFIEEEFNLLNSITRNSDPKLKKVDKAQVRLMSGKNYENASFLDGYETHCRFIAQSAPLVNTVDDFWQVIFEWKVSTIVMLNHLDSSATYLQPWAIYWPETVDGVIKSRRLRIQLKSQENREHVVIRIFSIKKLGPKAGQKESTLKQYQVLDWPSEQDIPNRLETLLDVYEMVESDAVANNPIIVHCINGIGRTGVYCAATEVLDRMRQHEIIDIFQSIKKLRANRSELIENLDQYILCYDLVDAYLHRFATYSN